jgi:pimeloyl-ACP methyl ester carboxylesterase
MMDLAFEVFGDTNKRPIVILHGFFASVRNWRACAEKLSKDYCVYAIDARNHGASPHHSLMDYHVMASDVMRFIEEQEIAQVNIIGHSMGGKTAMWLALNYPEYVDNLIVVDIAPISYSHSFTPLIHSLKQLSLASLTNRKQAELQLAQSIPELSYRQFLLQNLLLINGSYQWRIDLDIFERNGDNIIAFPNTDNLSPFYGNTLFIAGEESNYIPPNSTQSLFPCAKLCTISHAEHWVHVQQPDAFIKAVTDFLPMS